MPVPFGFGVGDFIAIASLANGIIKSLSEARGSAVQYASLIELLRFHIDDHKVFGELINWGALEDR
jgi:hypothetical protein